MYVYWILLFYPIFLLILVPLSLKLPLPANLLTFNIGFMCDSLSVIRIYFPNSGVGLFAGEWPTYQKMTPFPLTTLHYQWSLMGPSLFMMKCWETHLVQVLCRQTGMQWFHEQCLSYSDVFFVACLLTLCSNWVVATPSHGCSMSSLKKMSWSPSVMAVLTSHPQYLRPLPFSLLPFLQYFLSHKEGAVSLPYRNKHIFLAVCSCKSIYHCPLQKQAFLIKVGPSTLGTNYILWV